MYYQETYKGYSPWGGIQHSSVIAKGMKAVVTASHGGYMVTKTFADKYLSESCKKQGDVYYNYLCYEEDCAYAVLAYDVIDKFGDKMKPDKYTMEEYKESLLKSLSYYYPEYLIERGIKPLEKEYKNYLDGKKRDKLRAEKNPDLIISASFVNKEVIKVWTADNKVHFVSKESYYNQKETSNILYLSKCDEEVGFEEVV